MQLTASHERQRESAHGLQAVVLILYEPDGQLQTPAVFIIPVGQASAAHWPPALTVKPGLQV